MIDEMSEDLVPEPAPKDAIVVGHDGSGGGDLAFASAVELADRLGASVVVVRAWSIATAPRPPTWKFGYVSSFEELADTVRDHLVQDVSTHLQRFPGIEVDYRAVHGNPAKNLIAISKQARMLVVGSRGLGGFAGMVLGSVSDQCVRYAACPVLVVRKRD
ncbi:MAG TPA: universal stress protein [Nocardioides sp.]|jgi:nucleotide-binding universal stress UspA family protein|nr:universal stress protein [Nocardioides sp.]